MLDLSAPMEAEIILGDETLIVTYRRPTAKEMAAFRAVQVKRKGKKLVNNMFKVRFKGGLKVITGFKKGFWASYGKPYLVRQRRSGLSFRLEKHPGQGAASLSLKESACLHLKSAGDDVEFVSEEEGHDLPTTMLQRG